MFISTCMRHGNDHPLLWSVAMFTLAMFTFSSFSEEEKGLNLTPIWPSFPKEEAHGHGCWVLTSTSCQRQRRDMDHLFLLSEQSPGKVYWSGLGANKDLPGKGTWTCSLPSSPSKQGPPVTSEPDGRGSEVAMTSPPRLPHM